MPRVISFSSGKGGVGKTTLVANFGSLFAQQGKRTLLIDGDWNLGKLSITLGVRPQWTIEKVLRGEIPITQAVEPVAENLSLLASPSGAIGFESLSDVVRRQLFFEMEKLGEENDLILFDHSSGANWDVLEFAAASHQHIIVTTAEPTSFTDAYAIMKLLSKRFAIREFWVLATMSYHEQETERIMERFCDVARSQLDVRVGFLDILPWEAGLVQSIRHQKPFVTLHPDSTFTHRLKRLCRKIESVNPPRKNGLDFFYAQQAYSA